MGVPRAPWGPKIVLVDGVRGGIGCVCGWGVGIRQCLGAHNAECCLLGW